MATTREPGDLPFQDHAFPGGVLRRARFFTAGWFVHLSRTPIVEDLTVVRPDDE
jgi:hypothetical protein